MKPIIDMYLAAAVISYGGRIDRVDRSDPDKQRFYFKDRPLELMIVMDEDKLTIQKDVTLDQVCDAFVARTLVFPPNYPESIRSVKTAIYTGK